jgi:hypothetical protein
VQQPNTVEQATHTTADRATRIAHAQRSGYFGGLTVAEAVEAIAPWERSQAVDVATNPFSECACESDAETNAKDGMEISA